MYVNYTMLMSGSDSMRLSSFNWSFTVLATSEFKPKLRKLSEPDIAVGKMSLTQLLKMVTLSSLLSDESRVVFKAYTTQYSSTVRWSRGAGGEDLAELDGELPCPCAESGVTVQPTSIASFNTFLYQFLSDIDLTILQI